MRPCHSCGGRILLTDQSAGRHVRRWEGGELRYYHGSCFWRLEAAEAASDETPEEARASLEEDLERDREHDAAEWSWED